MKFIKTDEDPDEWNSNKSRRKKNIKNQNTILKSRNS